MLFEFGSRTDNDVILHLKREFIDTKFDNSMPKFTFSFDDEQINISYVTVMADVSVVQWITINYMCLNFDLILK